MLSLFVTLLTIVLFLDCVFLILLILMQLPKKEAGLGQAFGSAATDALFGAGSGNVLTKTTKYAAATFFVLAIILTILGPQVNKDKQRLRGIRQFNNTSATQPGGAAPVTAQPVNPLGITLLDTNAKVEAVVTNAAAKTNK